MSNNENVIRLKIVLLIAAAVSLFYGFGFLFIPGTLVKMSGGMLVDVSWLRWSGGVLVAWTIGTLMVFRKPEKQHIFLTSLTHAHLLAGLGLLYGWIRQEFSGATWFIAVPACLLLIIAVLLLWSRKLAREIL